MAGAHTPVENCPQCGKPMVATAPGSEKASIHRVSRDHILPRVRGGTAALPDGVNNFRTMCQVCNGFVASCFHCVVTAMCVRSVAEDTRVDVANIMRKWGITKVSRRLNADAANRLMRDELRRVNMAECNRPVTIADLLAHRMAAL